MKISLTVTNEHHEVDKERCYEMVKEAFSKLNDEMHSELFKLMEWMKINNIASFTIKDDDEEYMQ